MALALAGALFVALAGAAPAQAASDPLGKDLDVSTPTLSTLPVPPLPQLVPLPPLPLPPLPLPPLPLPSLPLPPDLPALGLPGARPPSSAPVAPAGARTGPALSAAGTGGVDIAIADSRSAVGPGELRTSSAGPVLRLLRSWTLILVLIAAAVVFLVVQARIGRADGRLVNAPVRGPAELEFR